MLSHADPIQSLLNPRPHRLYRGVHYRSRVAACLAILAASATGCSVTNEADDVVTWDEFRDAAVRAPDGQEIYIVDGDIRVSLERLEELYDNYVTSAEEWVPRSAVNTVLGNVDRWSGAQEHNLSYCVSNSFGVLKGRVVQEMSAAARSWELAANIDFKYVPSQDGACTASNANVLFAVRPWDSGGAAAFFPSSPVSFRTLFIDYDDFDNSDEWATLAPRLNTLGVLRHELGHILGLRHEHTRPESSVCFEDKAWKALGRYDQRSVMHYQHCNGVSTTDYTLTVADQQGVRTLYGPPAVVGHERQVPVDFDGDGRSDIGLTGPSDWQSLPTAFSTGSGFNVTNQPHPQFAGWAATPGVMTATGDFNGDGRTDIALTGPSSWNSIPIAFYSGSGNYNVTNNPVSQWAEFAKQDNAKILTGDFNGDGRTDLGLLGPANWASLPVAMSNGNGAFTVTNHPIASVGGWANAANVRLLTGDFDGDGKTDIALTGAAGWGSVPVAFSNGDGSFTVTNEPISNVGSWSAAEATVVLPGDFNGDGRTDFALTGPSNWNSIPVAFSNGDGTFNVTNTTDAASTLAAGWSEQFGARALAGDFNGDGRTDIALTGPDSWNTLPVAFSNGNGSFNVTNQAIASFGDFAETGARTIIGDYNGDGRSDIALTGPATWSSVPVAYALGNGAFSVPNPPTVAFPTWAAREGVTTLE